MEKIDWEKVVDRMKVWQWVITAAVLAIGAGVAIIFGKNLPPEIPLFYSRPWGEEQLAKPLSLGIPIGLCVLVAILTGIILGKFKDDKVLAAMLLGSGLIAEIILLLGVLRIVMLVS